MGRPSSAPALAPRSRSKNKTKNRVSVLSQIRAGSQKEGDAVLCVFRRSCDRMSLLLLVLSSPP
jgi:hypothetical protein